MLSKPTDKNSPAPLASDDPKALADHLYKQNVEISNKNKIFSLLSKLYEVSILTLEPKELAERICKSVQVDLSFELVGILKYNSQKKELSPLAFASSERLNSKTSHFHKTIKTTAVPVAHSAFLKHVIETKSTGYSEKIEDIWQSLSESGMVSEISEEGHVKSCIVCPLIIQKEVIGLLVLNLNRLYSDLVEFEKSSIESFTKVIAVALDKALLYEQLKIANEKLKSLDLARAEFISIASHQLRTPPATMKWYLAAILAGDYGVLNEELKEALNMTQQTNNGLISLIEDLLNVSRIERGKMEFLFEPVDVGYITQLAFDQLVPIAKEKKLKFTLNRPDTTLPSIMADKEKLRQVINNMIDNALKYTKEGGVEVNVYRDDKDIKIEVKDTGKGIGKEEIKNVFEKYKRGKDSNNHAAGLGLGMYVAKIIIEQHKGNIEIKSEGEGKGSTFAVTLPIKNNLQATTMLDLTEQQKV